MLTRTDCDVYVCFFSVMYVACDIDVWHLIIFNMNPCSVIKAPDNTQDLLEAN